MPSPNLAPLIDHTLLKPETTPAQIEQLCAEARQYGFASTCTNPAFVALCAERLRGSPVKVCTVIGFPLGATLTAVKAFEAEDVVRQGASELDMVLNIGALKAANLDFVKQDIAAVVQVGHSAGALVKVIIETCLLNDNEKITACRIAQEAGADFVKTSTGFSTGGATTADIARMRRTVGSQMGVKASGGIRALADVQAMIDAGANRIGTSAGVKIMLEA